MLQCFVLYWIDLYDDLEVVVKFVCVRCTFVVCKNGLVLVESQFNGALVIPLFQVVDSSSCYKGCYTNV